MIKTERLYLTRISQEDIDLIFDINNDPECIRFNGWDSMSVEKCREVIDHWIQKYSSTPNWGVYCVKSVDCNDKIGMAYIISCKEPDRFEIGFRLRHSMWDKGFAKELTRGFIAYAGYTLHANEVIAEVYKANTRSSNVFEKLGFHVSNHPDGEDGLLYTYEIKKNS